MTPNKKEENNTETIAPIETNHNSLPDKTSQKDEAEGISVEEDVILATKYRNGIDTTPDQYKAVALYKKAAQKGDNNALVMLADYYQQGIWIKKDESKAKELLLQAANTGYLPAQWQLEYLNNH